MTARRAHYREFFLMHNGVEPWPCYNCGEAVYLDKLVVHHIDGDHDNNALTNLSAVTSSCHRILYNKDNLGRKRGPNKKLTVFTDEHKAAVKAAVIKRYETYSHSVETREKIAKARRGTVYDEVYKAKMSEALKASYKRRREGDDNGTV